ncbi:MAG: DUF2249 domain-containing protein [Chitinophagaceae bacterium]
MAGRTSIAMASKVGGCTVNDFYYKLMPLGFNQENEIIFEEKNNTTMDVNEFLKNFTTENIVELDVRPVLAGGTDPFKLIMAAVNNLQIEQVLKIINTFEPAPLVSVLKKKGFESFVEKKEANLVHAFFYRSKQENDSTNVVLGDVTQAWAEIVERFKGNIQELDVRQLEMPQPMMKILETLDMLPAEKALLVHHKKIPLFLLPELAERKFEYRLNEIGEGEVQLLIFRP